MFRDILDFKELTGSFLVMMMMMMMMMIINAMVENITW
jgi:hypothetical protein